MKNIIIILFLFFSNLSIAQEKCPTDFTKNEIPKHLVVDYADILSDAEERNLERKLIDFGNETSNQILVISVNDLCDMDKAQFTNKIGENWGVGQADFDNGIVLMIKPHGGQGERHTFIAVGRGLEGAIPDAISSRIIRNELIPYFKSNDFNGGINAGVDVLIGLAKGEISSDKYGAKEPVPIFPLIFIILIIFLVFYSNVNRVRKSAVGKDLSFWAAFWLLTQSGHRRGGGWNDFHSGGGSFGGGSGFGGFGGGSFGGGGAGGSW